MPTNLRRVLLLLVAAILALQGRAQLQGYILDSETGDSIAYASVIYRGHGVAVASNLGGYYKIDRHNGWALTFSAVGYTPKTINIGANTKATLNVRLKPDNRMLKEVTVKTKRRKYSRKDNPAVELMKKVVEHKKRTDLSHRDYYQYNKYQKITLAINDLNQAKIDTMPKLRNKPWLKDQIELCPYNNKLILPLSVDETVTQKIYRRSPHSEKSIIKGQNSSGVNDIFQTGDILTTILKDVFTDVNIYDDQVRLLQYPFTSPIGKDAVAFYRYYIIDTIYVERDKCIHLHFLPNNQQDFGFRGDIYILADSSYQVKRCELTIPKKSDVNFIEDMQVVQEFTRQPDSTWVLTTDDMIAELKINKLIPRAAVIRTTRLSDYAFDELPRQLFKGKAREVKEADAMMRGDDFWKKYRQVELTQSESKMDAFVHHIEQIKGFKYIVFVAKAFIENFVETGKNSKFDLGPINTMLSTNFVDGARFRLTGQSTANLSKHFFVRGYAAYGTKTHKKYYSADLIWSFNKKEYLPREFPKRTLTFSSSYDICSPSDKFMHTDKDNVFTALKWAKVDRMMFYNKQTLSFEREEDWGFKTTLELKCEENEPCGNLYFVPLGAAESVKLRTTELHAELRFAPGETFINTKQRRLPINLDAPVFTIGHTMGIRGFLGGDYTYHLTEASIYKRFWLNSWGKVDCMVKGGVQWSKVPFPLLCMPETNLSYILQDYTFEIINNMEFLNDRYASAIIGWDLNGKLFNRIPLLKKLKCREWLSFRCLWGDLSDKNNPTLAANAGDSRLMMFPESSFIMDPKRPYMEMSVGVHNIFKLIQVEYVRRLNYNNLPTAHKHGVRFMIRMTF